MRERRENKKGTHEFPCNIFCMFLGYERPFSNVLENFGRPYGGRPFHVRGRVEYMSRQLARVDPSGLGARWKGSCAAR